MAKNTVCLFVVILFTAFCCLKSTSNAQTVLTSSEVISLLNSFSLPLNLTMARKFLTEVKDSEIGLCLNLTNNETEHRTSIADTSLASLHVSLTNYTILKKSVHRFPCLHCPNLSSSSPTAVFVLSNETLHNVTCLAGSRFADDFQLTQQNPLRLSDVMSLSLIDENNMSFVHLSHGETVYLKMPLARLPNNSRGYKLKCVGRPLDALHWSSSLCTTNQTLKLEDQTRFIQCNCSSLGYFAVFVDYLNHTGGNPATIVGPYASLSLRLHADCKLYLFNASTKADFLNSTEYSIAHALNISVSNIINMEASCGSIFVNFTLLSPDGTNGTLSNELLEFSNLIQSDSYKVPLDNTEIWPLTLQISANYNLTISTHIVSKYFIKLTATTPTIKTSEVQPLVVDYTPFMISVAVILFLLVVCICGTCCAHTWYLKKKKYTKFNSDKVKPKVVEPVVEEEEVAPPEFGMTFTERQEVNERQMARYDWARTSFVPEHNDTSAFLTSAAVQGPKLILDCQSDDESESPLPPGDVAINMEEEGETSENSGGSEEITSEEDEEDDAPLHYECKDNIQEGVREQKTSNASLTRSEEDIVQETTEEQDREHENAERLENEENVENEVGNEPAEKDKQTDGRKDNEENQNERQDEEESPNDDNEEPRQDNDDNDVIQDDVTQDDVTQNDIKQDDATQDDAAQDDATQDDATQDDARQDENEDNEGTNEDLAGTSQRAPSRSQGTSLNGMPEPSM